MFHLLLLALCSQYAQAGVITAPTPGITPPPVLRRDVTTAGYRSTGMSGGTTLWGTVTINLEDQIIATSGSLYRLCIPGDTCDFFTCSGDYVVYPSSSSYCGTSSGLTCSWDVSFTDMSDTSPMTNMWCDDSTLDGWDIFATTPSDDPTTTPDPITTDPTTSTSSSSSSSSISPVPTPTPGPDDKKSTPIGAIVGGVVGGLAVIGIIIVLVVILLRKNRKAAASAPVASMQSPMPQHPPPMVQQYHPHQGHVSYYDPNAGAGGPLPEKTPAMTTNAYPYYTNGEQVQQGPASPVPQYTPNNGAVNELPATRM